MAHCVNPECKKPENQPGAKTCESCGFSLLLNDRYEIVRSLGQGGFGATFLAKNQNLPGQPYCVIKQLRPTSTAPNVLRMARDLFQREAATLGKIGSHPQIPTLMDYFEEATEFYLVQEFIKGYTLHQEVKKSGPFTEAGVRQVLSELLPMLEYIHGQQVIHRDIKPANIIRRSQDKKLVMIDFGAVKDKVNPVATSASEQTALTSYAIGTPGYAPPEQMAMRPVYSSDIYAVGVTGLYLLTGKSPKDLNYNPATGEIMWQQHVTISDHLSDVLRKMLEVSVKHRYQSPQEVLQALSLEPYMDSLVGGMMSQPVHNEPPAADYTPSVSPSARMAQAIRARKQAGQQRRTGGRPAHTQLNSNGRLTSGGNSTSNLRSRGGVTSNGRQNTGRQNTRSQANTNRMKQRLHPMELQKRYDRGDRDFTMYDFRSVNLQRLVLTGANFHETNLGGANLQNAELSNTDFGHAGLNQAKLKGARLIKAYMSHANLQEADLRGADLSNAYLSNANLRGANLSGANLRGAKVTDEQLSLAKLNWSTVFPNGRRGGLW